MPVTVCESIALELYDRLLVLVGNTTYPIDIVEVVRPTRLGNYTPRDMQIVLTQGESEVVEELSCPGNPPAIARRQRWNCHCHLMNDETSEESIDARINEFYGCVVQAICDPANEWHTFGGYAIDAMIGDPEMINADGGIDGVTVPVYATYRTDENDPYELR